jgi:CheY-like chemotaxis protein
LQIPTLTVPPKLSTIKPETQDYLMELEHSPGDLSPSPALEEIWGQVPLLDPLADSPSSVASPTPEASPPLSARSLNLAEFFSWMANSVIFVLSYNRIEEYLTPKPDQVIQSRNQRFLHWRDQMIRVYPLSDLLNNGVFLSGTAPRSTSTTSMLMVRQGQQMLALESDLKRSITEPTLLIHAQDDLATPSYLWGYTRLENDTLLPVVDVAALLNCTLGDRAQMDHTSTQPLVARKLSSPPVASDAMVLVVDDSAAMRKLLSTALEEVGYRVLQAQDGQAAIEQLQKDFQVHLIICDIEMPRLNGFEFLRWYFQNPSIAKVPVVMLSSWDSDESRQMAMAWGAVAYFTKPYNKPKFLAMLQTIGAAGTAD